MPHSQTKVLDFHLHCVCNRLAVEWKCTAPVLDGPSDGFEHARCLIFRASSFLTNDGSESLLKCHSHKQRQVTFIFVTLTTGWQWSGNTERFSQAKAGDFHLCHTHNRLAVEWKYAAPVFDGPSNGFEQARCLNFRASFFLTNDGPVSLLKHHAHKQKCVTFIFIVLATGLQWSGNAHCLFLMVPATVLSRPDASCSCGSIVHSTR
jgi:hypothetical protein